jgi:hypothetical protein
MLSEVICALMMAKCSQKTSSYDYIDDLNKRHPMIFSINCFLSLHIIAASQTMRLEACAYYTHLNLSCQTFREAASHIIVLTIIPPV